MGLTIFTGLVSAQAKYDLRAGAECWEGYEPLTSSWQDCEAAARSLGHTGDSVNFVDYNYPWGTARPQGCFRSNGNNRFHFNRQAGGGSQGNDRILCIISLNIRFNKPMYDATLGKSSFPLSQSLANELRGTDASSVTIQADCGDNCLNIEEILATDNVDAPMHPSRNPDSPYWNDFREVIARRQDREANTDPTTFMPLPNIWRGYDIHQIAEAVHDEFPGVWHAALLGEFLGEGVEFDRTTLPGLSKVDFINGAVALSGLNGWAFANVGPTNFGAKWYNGRARPEEIAFLIHEDEVTSADGVPQDIVDNVKAMGLSRAPEFTAYIEGSPVHPSWPAMHSASSVGSLWIATVLNLTPEQQCETRRLDYAMAYARTVAGVHFPTDNTGGLNLGQEVVARKLPEYLAEQYGSDIDAVNEKIASLRFDWRTFTQTECYRSGLSTLEKGVEHSTSEITLATNYGLDFSVQPFGTLNGWSNILHLTADNTNGSRLPGVWFRSGTTRMHVCIGCDGNANMCLNLAEGLPLYEESRVSIDVGHGRFSVSVNGDEVAGTTCNQPTVPASGATGKLYTSDPWYQASNAVVSTITYTPKADRRRIEDVEAAAQAPLSE